MVAAKMKAKDNSPNAWKAALLNYRTWVMCLNYGYCFGVELVVDNVITYYLYDQFRLNAVVAGAMGSIFGCVSNRAGRLRVFFLVAIRQLFYMWRCCKVVYVLHALSDVSAALLYASGALFWHV